MKKVFAIIAIMVVLVGAVFADNPSETHTIHIKTTVDAVLPQFQLKLAKADTLANTVDYITNNDTTADPAQPQLFDDGEAYLLGGTLEADAIDVSNKVILDKETAQSIVFSVIIANRPKINSYGNQSRAWTLSFTGGTFNVTKAGTAGTIVPTVLTSNGTDYDNGVTVTGVGETSAVVTLTTTPPDKDGIEIVKATYTWTGDRTVDPDTYDTTIIMTVTQN